MSIKDKIYLQVIHSEKEFLGKIQAPVRKNVMPLLLPEQFDIPKLGTDFHLIDKDLLEIAIDPEEFDMAHGCIVADRENLNGRFAEHYAALLDRPFLHIPSELTFNNIPDDDELKDKATSYTIFLPSDKYLKGNWKINIEKILKKNVSKPLSFGYIHCLPFNILSNYLLNCIVGFLCNNRPEAYYNLTVINCDSTSMEKSDKIISCLKSNIPFTILNHSRPHCSRIKCSDEKVILCGSPNLGKDGKCFSDFDCTWKDSKKVFMSQMSTNFLFLNGCSTARFGETSYGVPTSSMFSYASATGQVLNYIGNSHVGRYSESDSDWIEVLLSMNVKPAKAAVLINELRRVENRQGEDACTFIGDAESCINNVNSPTTFEYIEYSSEMKIVWDDNNLFLCLLVKGENVANLHKDNLLAIEIPEARSDGNILFGSFIYNPFANYSIGLFKKKRLMVKNKPLAISIKTLPSAPDFNVGKKITSTVNELNTYKGSDLYSNLLNKIDLKHLEGTQLHIYRNLDNQMNVANKFWIIGNLIKAEEDLVRNINEQLLKIAINFGQEQMWMWEEKYLSFFSVKANATTESKCSFCGNISFIETLISYAYPDIRRENEVCTSCGIIRDMPISDIECGYLAVPPQYDENSFSDNFYIRNKSDQELQIAYAPIIIGFSNFRFRSIPISITLKRGETKNFSSNLSYDEKPSGLFWVRVYFACNGSFGYISKLFIFQ